MDFEKAYDKVSHPKLLTLLAEQGCGAQFLSAIANTLKDTLSSMASLYYKLTHMSTLATQHQMPPCKNK